MKLIDIEDEMLLKNLFCGGLSAKKVTRLFMNQPEIEAIPIDWIENKIADIKNRPDDDYSISDCYELRISEVWSWLLEFWREENQ